MAKPVHRVLRERLAALLIERGWSQSELARRAVVGQSTISRLLTGETSSTSLDKLERIAGAFGLEVSDLIGTEPLELSTSVRRRQDVETGTFDIQAAIPAYIASDYYLEDQPSPEEMRWLAQQPPTVWFVQPPPPADAIHALLIRRRETRRADKD